MNSLASALVFCLLLTPQKVGEVVTDADKAADFSALHTYAWSKGHDAFDPRAHKAIIAEVETQMTALGFKQAPAASADVLLTYHTVRASEIDLKKLDELLKKEDQATATAGATRILGNLALVMSRPSTRATIWSAVTRRTLSDDPAKWNAELHDAVDGVVCDLSRQERQVGRRSAVGGQRSAVSSLRNGARTASAASARPPSAPAR